MEIKYITNWFYVDKIIMENYKFKVGYGYNVGKTYKIGASTMFPNNHKDIFIPAYYENKECIAIAGRAFAKYENLEVVTIDQGIKFIEDYAFEDCKNLKRIYLPNTIQEISPSAFDGCKSLEEIILIEGAEYFNSEWFEDIALGRDLLIKLPSTLKNIDNVHYCGFIYDIDKSNNFYKVENDFVIDKRTNSIVHYQGCGEVLIPTGVKTIKESSISVYQEELIIPEGIEEIDVDFELNFDSCIDKITIYLPSTLKKISKYAFYYGRDEGEIVFTFKNGNEYIEYKNGEFIEKKQGIICKRYLINGQKNY